MNLHNRLKKFVARVNSGIEQVTGGAYDIRCGYANSTENKYGERPNIPWKGRVSLHLGGRRPSFVLAWAMPGSRVAALEFDIDRCESGATLSASLIPLTLHFSVENINALLDKVGFKKDRIVGFYLTRSPDIFFHWNGWKDPHESRTADPWWVEFSFFPVEKLFGTKKTQGVRIIEEKETLVPMPEGSYKMKAKLEEYRFGFSRLPWFWETGRCVQYDLDPPMPYGRKGPLYGGSMSAQSIPEAVGKLVGDCMREYDPRYPEPSPEAQRKARARQPV